MADILITVSGQSMVFTSMPVIASHGVNEDYVEFTFDSDWTGFAKVATFWHERTPETIYTTIVNGSNRALVPHEVTQNAGRIFIGVTGTQGSIKLTSEVLPYPILPGSNDDGENSGDITPDMLDQILSAMAEMVGTPLTANTAADMVDTSRIYVYTGSEVGYVNGSWYYYNGSSWVVGGVYNSQAISDAFRDEIADLVKQSAVATESDSTPYLFRPTPNPSAILADEEIFGGTIAHNQLMPDVFSGHFTAYNGTAAFNDGIPTVTANGNGTNFGGYLPSADRFSVTGHKYYCLVEVNSSKAGSVMMGLEAATLSVNANTKTRLESIQSATANNKAFTAYKMGAVASDTMTIYGWNCIDLTAEFGSQIADYLYTLESGTAGAGVAKLREWGFLSKPYFAHDSGSLVSVNTEGKRVYDKNDNLLATYPTTPTDLNGIFKLDSNNQLYADGDVYKADGTVSRKYGIMNLGDMNWLYDSATPRFYAGGGMGIFAPVTDTNAVAPLRCPLYTAVSFNSLYTTNKDNMTMAVSSSGALSIINTSYSTAAAFKTAMNGVYLVYELATPTTETADTYPATQIVGKGGTEEWIDERSVPVPVGHRTTYSIGVPDVPANANNATLHATVNNGKTTLTWS